MASCFVRFTWAVALFLAMCNHGAAELQQSASSSLMLAAEEDPNSCGAKLQHKFNCTEYDCQDRVAGYINYLSFFYCTASNPGLQALTFIMFLVWALFLLHVVETTTNE
jgi:hypothetical protein